MQLGIFARTFAATGAMPSLSAVRDAGYEVAQFNMAVLGGPPMPEAITPEICEEIVAASRATGIEIAAVSGTYNMIHPDPTERAAGFARLTTLLSAARLMGTRLVTLCTGTRHPTDQWAHHPDNAGAAAWNDLLTEMGKAVEVAEQSGIDLGVEPEMANVVSSAVLARRLMDTLRSPRIRIVLDPANLFERASAAEARNLVEHAVDLLADRIVMGHAKDRRADGAFATAGKGIVDFRHFVRMLSAAGFDGPLVTHGLSEVEAPQVAAFLREVIAEAAA